MWTVVRVLYLYTMNQMKKKLRKRNKRAGRNTIKALERGDMVVAR